MAVYRYVKKTRSEGKISSKRQRVVVKGIGLGVMALGLVILAISVGPVGFYEIFTAWRFRDANLLSPMSFPAGRSEVVASFGQEPDLSKAAEWYPGLDVSRDVPSKVNSYILAIPKLGINQALVRIGGADLSKSLVHFGSTALPGEKGNGVIIGHSTLPGLYDPANYLTIFSQLPQMGVGDEFVVYYDGVEYRYRVEDMREVEPNDLSVLAQTKDDSYITLVTCVPPGLTTRRLAIRGRLLKS